jgi:threonine dehydrogenase-like Zn-dependent dehydrogenase
LKTTVADRKGPPRMDQGPPHIGTALAQVVIDEVTILGSRCGPFDRALSALESGDVQVLPLISERFDLSRGVEALERAGAPGVLKVLLDISPDAA